MNSGSITTPVSPSPRRSWRFAAGLVVAIVLAYANTFSVPFVFDDIAAVTQNPSLAHLGTALVPPPGLSVTGRPLVNLSLALNHAISGEAVWSYHVFNLALHVANALLLFALLRSTLPVIGRAAAPGTHDVAALVAASLWALHPLQTAAVTYVMQRSELLVSLCYLVTLHAFARAARYYPLGECSAGGAARSSPGLRSTPNVLGERHRTRIVRWGRGAITARAATCENGNSRGETTPPPSALTPDPLPDSSAPWLLLSAAACLLGMTCKEVMVTAPLAVLLYDRTFVARSFAAALRARPGYYAALAATWLLLAGLTLGTDNRGASAGFAAGLAWTDYALTQLHALALYLRLAVWPSPLVFDYGTGLVREPAALFLPGMLLVALLGVTAAALRRRPALGFAGALFFLLLAPTTSVVPIATQTIAEHRVYLALALPIALVAFVVHRTLRPAAILAAALPVALLFGVATFARNTDYRTTVDLWRDTVAKRPANARAHYNLGISLLVPGASRNPAQAIGELQETLRLDAAHALAPGKLGGALLELGRFAEAVAPLTSAVRRHPADATLHYQLAGALLATGRTADAVTHLAESVRLNPAHAAARYNYGRALTDLGRYDDALAQFDEAARLDPADASARTNAARLRDFLRK